MLIGHTYIFFGQMSSQIPCSFLNWVICLFILSSNLYVLYIFILDIRSLSDVWFANVFSHSLGYLFILLTVSFDTQKFSIWIKSNFSFFFFFYWSRFPFPAPGDLPDPGIKPVPPALAGGFFTTEPPEKSLCVCFVWPCCAACEILVPWLGVRHKPSVVKAWNPNH